MKQKGEQKRLVEVLFACRSSFVVVFLFSIVINALMLVSPIYTLQVLDRVISSANLNTLVVLSMISVFAIMVLALMQGCRSFLLMKIGEWLDIKLSSFLVKKTVNYSSELRHDIGSLNIRDLSSMKNFITGPSLTAILDAPWSILYILVIFAIHPLNAVITIIGAVLLFIFAILNEYFTVKHLKESNSMSIINLNRLSQYSRNAEVIESMGMLNNLTNIWQADNSKMIAKQSVASYRGTVIANLAKLARMILQIAIMGTGAYLVLNNEMSMGGIIACSIIAGRALAPFDNAIASWKHFITSRQSYNRLKETIENTPVRAKGIDLPKPTGTLMVKDLIYAPPGAKLSVITNFNFTANPGDSIAVVGHSAAGKSTLAKLIVGIYRPTGGNLRLDGADVYAWNRDDFGKHVGYLSQQAVLFEGSVRDNICRFCPDAEDLDIVKAAQIAGVHELILALPDGYETIINSPKGVQLSAGQKQRIGLARAFFGDVKLVVLDEPNSNLDQEGDKALQKSLIYAKENNITLFIISHRSCVLSYVDKILLINKGNLASYGNKDKVLELIKQGKLSV